MSEENKKKENNEWYTVKMIYPKVSELDLYVVNKEDEAETSTSMIELVSRTFSARFNSNVCDVIKREIELLKENRMVAISSFALSEIFTDLPSDLGFGGSAWSGACHFRTGNIRVRGHPDLEIVEGNIKKKVYVFEKALFSVVMKTN